VEWREELKAAAQAQGLPGETHGAFYLASTESQLPPGMKPSIFWGAEFGPAEAAPWAEAMDFLASESWQTRFRRKSEEWGESAEIGIVMGRAPGGGWLAALEPSLQQSPDGSHLQIGALDTGKKWLDAYEDFSRIMDLPLRRPRWMLGLAGFNA